MAGRSLRDKKDALGGELTPEEQHQAVLEGFQPFWVAVRFAFPDYTANIKVWAKSEETALREGAAIMRRRSNIMSVEGIAPTELRGFCPHCLHLVEFCPYTRREEAIQHQGPLPSFEVDWTEPPPAPCADPQIAAAAAYARRAGLGPR